MIPQRFIEDLNRDADIVSVIGRHVELKQKGKSHTGLCPFHKEKTPSFNVVPEKGFYHCFGCGASGTALGFLMRHSHGNDFVAAVHDLAAQLGREVPSDGSRKSVPTPLLEQMAAHYHAQLRHHPEVREYLKGRGISKGNALRFRLGYAPRDGGFAEAFGKDYESARLKGGLVSVGLAKKSERNGDIYPYFRDRLMIPITSNTGKVQGFGGRLMSDGEPKYLNSPQSEAFDKGRVIFALREATDGFREHGGAIVVEGYMDVLVLFEHGITNAVATMGTAATTQQVSTIMTRADRVCFCFDGDDAGRKAAARVLQNVMPAMKDGKSVSFAHLPKGEDPDSYVSANGAERFRELVDNAMKLEKFLVNKDALLPGGDDGLSGESVMWHKAAELVEYIDKDRAPFVYELLYKELADASGIGLDDLKTAGARIKKSRPSAEEAQRRAPQPRGRRKMKEHALYNMLSCLYLKPELASMVENEPLDFGDNVNDLDLCIKVRDKLIFAHRNEEDLTVESILSERGLIGLLDQLRVSTSIMREAKVDPEQKMKLIVEKFRSLAGRKKRRKELQSIIS